MELIDFRFWNWRNIMLAVFNLAAIYFLGIMIAGYGTAKICEPETAWKYLAPLSPLICMTKSEWANWVSGIGSVVAIAGMVWINWKDRKIKETREARIANLTAVSVMQQVWSSHYDLLAIKKLLGEWEPSGEIARNDILRLKLEFGRIHICDYEVLYALEPLDGKCAFSLASAIDYIKVCQRLIDQIARSLEGDRDSIIVSIKSPELGKSLMTALDMAAFDVNNALDVMSNISSHVASPLKEHVKHHQGKEARIEGVKPYVKPKS